MNKTSQRILGLVLTLAIFHFAAVSAAPGDMMGNGTCVGNPMRKSWNKFEPNYVPTNGSDPLTPGSWGFFSTPSNLTNMTKKFCKAQNMTCCNGMGQDSMKMRFMDAMNMFKNEREMRLRKFEMKKNWTKENLNDLINIFADAGAVVESSSRLFTKFFKKGKQAYGERFERFPKIGEFDIMTLVSFYQFALRMFPNLDPDNMDRNMTNNTMPNDGSMNLMQRFGSSKLMNIAQRMGYRFLQQGSPTNNMTNNMTNDTNRTDTHDSHGHDIGDDGDKGPFHNFHMKWPLTAMTGNKMFDDFINNINTGRGKINEIDFKKTRQDWRKRIKPMVIEKFAKLQKTKLMAFKWQKKCFELMLKMAGATGCLACDPNFDKVIYKMNKTDPMNPGQNITEYKLRFGANVGKKLLETCQPMIKGLNRLGKDYFGLWQLGMIKQFYAKGKALYRKIRMPVQTFVDSKMGAKDIERLLKFFTANGTMLYNEYKMMGDQIDGMLRESNIWDVVFKMPKNCTMQKCDLVKTWITGGGPDIERIAKLDKLRPNMTNMTNITLGDFYEYDPMENDDEDIFGWEMGLMKNLTSDWMDDWCQMVEGTNDCTFEPHDEHTKNGTWWPNGTNTTNMTNNTNPRLLTQMGPGSLANNRNGFRVLQGDQVIDSGFDDSTGGSGTTFDAGTDDNTQVVDDGLTQVAEIDQTDTAAADTAAVNMVTEEDAGPVGGTVFETCDGSSDGSTAELSCETQQAEMGGSGQEEDNSSSHWWIWLIIGIAGFAVVAGACMYASNDMKNEEHHITTTGDSTHHTDSYNPHQNEMPHITSSNIEMH